MKSYVIQSFKSDFGETDRVKLIVPETESLRNITVSDAAVSLSPEDGCAYECGALTSLTLQGFPERGWFSVTFVSGTQPTVVTIPQTLHMPDGFSVEANMRYELNVQDGFALCAGWAVSA